MYVQLSGSDFTLSRMDMIIILGLWASMIIARNKRMGFVLAPECQDMVLLA